MKHLINANLWTKAFLAATFLAGSALAATLYLSESSNNVTESSNNATILDADIDPSVSQSCEDDSDCAFPTPRCCDHVCVQGFCGGGCTDNSDCNNPMRPNCCFGRCVGFQCQPSP